MSDNTDDKETNDLMSEAKACLVDGIRDAGGPVDSVADTVSDTIARTLRGTRAVGSDFLDLIACVATGVVHGLAEVETETSEAARFAMVGVLHGARRIGRVGVEAVSGCATAVVRGAAEAGGDVGRAAKGAIEGAIESARDLGVSIEDASQAAAHGVLNAAGDLGAAGLSQVRYVLIDAISGASMLREPVRVEGRPMRPH
ncbi:MAG TPA: hypothetical protein VF363_08600 [Candidatus Eisenbacteria bacterium]